MFDDIVGDYPPIWINPDHLPPHRFAKHAFLTPDDATPTQAVTLLLVGRPDDDGTEPMFVIEFTPDDADRLATHLRREAEVVRRAR